MHIHGNQMNFNAINPYSAAAEKAAAAQRAADVRRKLARSANGVESVADPEDAFTLGRWMDFNPSLGEDAEYHTAASGRESDFA